MPTYRVVTNNRPRPLVAWNDLPVAAREEFDYFHEGSDAAYSPRFVLYRGDWWDTEDTEGLAPDSLRVHGFDTYLTQSFFDGIVFRFFDADGDLIDGGESVIVGRFFA